MKIIHFIVALLTIGTLFFGYHYFFSGTDENHSKQEQSSTQHQVEKENPVKSSKDKIYGLDISKYVKDEIDELSPEKNNLSFIICKATGGRTYTDPHFKDNWTKIKEKDFIRGAYHFYYTKDTPESQAENFTKVVDFTKSDLPPILDFEGASINTNESVETIQSNVLKFLKAVEEKTGHKPMIYTNLSVGNQYLNNAEFAEYPLWIAYYSSTATAPRIPDAWKDRGWKIWQSSESHSLDGFNDDFDVFFGSKEDLKKFVRHTN